MRPLPHDLSYRRGAVQRVEELSKEYEGKWLIAKCNVDESTDIPMKFGIRNIPTLLFFKDGVMKEKMVGSTTKSAIIAKMQSIE